VFVALATTSAQTARRSKKTSPGTTAAPKQAVADASQPFPLETLKVSGNQHFSEAEIIRISGLQPGQQARKADFDAAQQRLLDSGLFETVAYRYQPIAGRQSYAATWEVKEIAQLFPYRFEAIEVPETKLRAWLKEREPLFGDDIPATAPVLKRFTSDLQEYLATNNMPSEISGKLLPNDKGALEVVFQPTTLPAVAQVHFTGNKLLSTTTLQQGIAGSAVGALYTEKRFRAVLDASIRPLYEQRGHLRVSFPKIETKPATDVQGLAVTVQIAEGPPYKLRDVKITGEMADNARLLKEGQFHTGDVVDMKAVQDGAKRMEAMLKRRGYLNAAATIDRTVDDAAKQVDVAVNIDPGPQYRMGKLDIVGLDITTEPYIRKMWSLKEKSPFDFDYPDIFLKEMPDVLENLGKTHSTIKPDPGTLTVDVILAFTSPDKKGPQKDRRRPQEGARRDQVDFP